VKKLVFGPSILIKPIP